MKRLIVLLSLVSTICYSQSRAEVLEDAQKDVAKYWKASFDKYNKDYILPEFTYINGAYNVYYSASDNQIITSIDIVKDVFDRYGNAVIYFIYAHEFGHFIQFNSGNSELVSALKEYGADCFAGIYFKYLSDSKRLERGDHEKIVAFINDNTEKGMKLKDLFSLDSHGTANGRIEAFNLGYTNNSIRFCLTNYSTREIFSK